MIPLGSTNIQDHACGDAAWFFVFTPMMILPVDRQNWRVSGAGNVCGMMVSIIVKPAVINGYTLPLSSTITDGHSYGDVECPFCFYPDILPFIDCIIGGAWTFPDADFVIGFDQNPKFATQQCYTSRWQDGVYG